MVSSHLSRVRTDTRWVVGLCLAASGVLGVVWAVADYNSRSWQLHIQELEVQRVALSAAAQLGAQPGREAALKFFREQLPLHFSSFGGHMAIIDAKDMIVASTSGSPFTPGDPADSVLGEAKYSGINTQTIDGQEYLIRLVAVGVTELSLAVLTPIGGEGTGLFGGEDAVGLLGALLFAAGMVMLVRPGGQRAETSGDPGLEMALLRGFLDAAAHMAGTAIASIKTGRILAVNGDLLKTFGYDYADQLVGEDVGALGPEDYADEQAALVRTALRTGSAERMAFETTKVTGETIYIDIHIRRPWPGRDYLAIIVIDTTTFQNMERELALRAEQLESKSSLLEDELERAAATAARYRSLITNAPAAIIAVDGVTQKIVEANPQAQRDLGLTHDQLVGAPMDIIDASRGLNLGEILEQAAREGVVRHSELTVPRSAGVRPKYMDVTAAYVAAGDEKLFHLILLDVSQQRETQRNMSDAYRAMQEQAHQLEEAYAKLRDAAEAKSNFLATVSHELRAPLNSIVGFTELLLDETFGSVNGKQREFLSDMSRASEHLLKLLNDVLELARVEARRIQVKPAPVGVRQLLADAVSLTRGMAADKHQRLIIRMENDDLMVTADEYRSKQILVNLVSNALKYSPADTTVTLGARLSGVEVELSVADEGPGIAPEDQERIFHEFERADRGIDSEQKGFGLGLALAKHLVELHGGRIWLNSVLGAGSVFYFTLPFFEAPAEEEDLDVPQEAVAEEAKADDEEARRRRMREPGRG